MAGETEAVDRHGTNNRILIAFAMVGTSCAIGGYGFTIQQYTQAIPWVYFAVMMFLAGGMLALVTSDEAIIVMDRIADGVKNVRS